VQVCFQGFGEHLLVCWKNNDYVKGLLVKSPTVTNYSANITVEKSFLSGILGGYCCDGFRKIVEASNSLFCLDEQV